MPDVEACLHAHSFHTPFKTIDTLSFENHVSVYVYFYVHDEIKQVFSTVRLLIYQLYNPATIYIFREVGTSHGVPYI